jgi:HD domain
MLLIGAESNVIAPLEPCPFCEVSLVVTASNHDFALTHRLVARPCPAGPRALGLDPSFHPSCECAAVGDFGSTVSCMRLTSWAASNSERFLSPLGNRWFHVQQVARQAHHVAKAVPPEDRDLLIAAAYLHDVGYAPQLSVTGFHPLDGARWIRDHGPGGRLACLVAHHSCAIYEARVRGLTLVFCDMTTGPTGKVLSFDERIEEILDRYGPEHEVSRALAMSRASLAACHKRALARLNEGAA